MPFFARNPPAAPPRGETLRKLGRRFVFSLLALWVHGAALFFVSFVLFKGADRLDPASGPNGPTMRVTLVTEALPPPPESPENPAPVPDTAQAPVQEQGQPDKSPASPSTEKTPPATEKTGLLSCSSLSKKPERIIYGPDDVQ